MAQSTVMVKGLRDMRRDLGKIDKGLRKAADSHIREVLKRVRDTARSNLRSRSKNPQNRIERTIKHSLTAKRGGVVYSTHPGSAVQEYGGTISPRGAPIKIEGKDYGGDALDEHAGQIEEEVGGLLDGIADAYWPRF